jgi:outer membrane lipoprotein-sorting protein
MPDGTISFSVTVTDKDAEEVQGETTYRVSAKGEDLAMIETTAPARLKGRKLLMRGDDLWLYLPTVKRPTRVGLQQRLTGEVANGDIARTRFFVDYKPKKMGEEKIKGKTCHKLELKAKKKTTYRRILLWWKPPRFNPRKQSSLLSRANFSNVASTLITKTCWAAIEPHESSYATR